MLQALDYFRRLYKKETDQEFSIPPIAMDPAYYLVPTWDYVCWLEERLSKYETEPLPEASYTTTSKDSIGDILGFLRQNFPGHSFAVNPLNLRSPLYIDGRPIPQQFTHPDEMSFNVAFGQVPDQYATTEEYLKHELLIRVAKYLSSQGESNEHV